MSDESLFDTSVYENRLESAAAAAHDAGLAGLVLGTGSDLVWALGWAGTSHERLTALVIPADGAPTFVLPAVERGDLPASAVPALREPAGAGLAVELWEDGADAHQLVAKALGLPDITRDDVRVGIGGSLTADHVLPIVAKTRCVPVLAAEAVSDLLMAKDDAEVDQLREAGAAIDRVHARVPGMLAAGRTEAEVADDIRAAILEEGHTAVDFIIVGSGPNGANPHHDWSDRVISDGDVVVVDIGGTWGAGYHSDCTRTYVVGEADARTAAMYEVLRAAQQAAVDAVRPGARAEDIDAAARRPIEEAGYGKEFIHRTGHGIGLSLHEEPFIMAGNDLKLVPGMAFSIEPGIYVEGEVGMRLEDIVVVTEDGCERLNNSDRGLIRAAGAATGHLHADAKGKDS
ncbi:Xaa-Pro peptidase family protein [Corynebacterium sp.]|uniref:M24 family metallopeptidase n=1 Tax=Corynebacterium sp. TaxID=1720 RepID=UPI0026DBDF0E|nr:Xaa-Pro peptidase family protein [Corynebacterium sp.]MDO4609326.1 Xaa-Pro peptidase family protein [Corynebacterium sp.]